jgi:N utilization substance protein B
MSARHKARKRALDFLYESDIRGISAVDLFSKRPPSELSEGQYVKILLEGISTHRSKIDELIVTYAQGWDLDRMPSIDRNILRISLFEILWMESIDDRIAISEAIELAKELSTDESSNYVNGVLGRIVALKPALVL